MENDNNIVMEEITENVESTTTEEIVEDGKQVEKPSAETPPEKIYSEAEFQARVKESMDKKVPRMEAKIRKQYDDEYGSECYDLFINKEFIDSFSSVVNALAELVKQFEDVQIRSFNRRSQV